ncbi:MAG: cell division ATP-binding protein FtsE [Clostridia bacterium]|nr:cell division ATP-binding protein FtsE [Clostridia bacterium]
MIEFKNVKSIYKRNNHIALDDVSFKIEDGEFVFIVGHSGAGKTTMTKLLLREMVPTSGKIIVNGFNLKKMAKFKVAKYRRGLGVVFQDFKLFPKKTVYENIAFAMQVVGTPKALIQRRVPAILKSMGLIDKAKNIPEELSGGEQQRVAIARALANSPDIIIADEPTGNIDPQMAAEIMDLLLWINQKLGKTVVVVTHAENLVDAYRQRVIRLDHGKLTSDKIGGMFE